MIIEMLLETGSASRPTPGAPFIVSDPLSGGEHTNICINVRQRSVVDVQLHKLMTWQKKKKKLQVSINDERVYTHTHKCHSETNTHTHRIPDAFLKINDCISIVD